MARKVGQIIARGDRRWLIRVYLGRDSETKKRNYHNRTIRGSMREDPSISDGKLRERDLGRDLDGAKITLNEYLDRWLETAVKPRVRQKTCQDSDGILRRYIRPALGDRVLVSMRPMEIQTTYQGMIERGLSARTVHYTHAVLRSALRQPLQWRLLLESRGSYLGIGRPLRRFFVENRRHGLSSSIAMKSALTRNHLVQHSTERKDVGAMINDICPNPFGRHITSCAHYHARLRWRTGDREVIGVGRSRCDGLR